MLTQAELTKWRFIKAMAMTGRSAEVSRADKQWTLLRGKKTSCPLMWLSLPNRKDSRFPAYKFNCKV